MTTITVLVGAILGFFIAFLWNTVLFGRLHKKLANMPDEAPKNLGLKLLLNFLVSIVTSLGIYMALIFVFPSQILGELTILKGAIAALFLCLFFNVPANFIDVIWKDKSWKLWLFECAAASVVFVCVGATQVFLGI